MMYGLDVMYVQVSLNKLNYSLDADGYYGSKTASAVRCFQSDHGLDADGICGRMTWDAIHTAIEDYDRLAVVSQPEDITVNTGETADFSIEATGEELSYQWYYKKSGASSWNKWNGHTTAATSAVSNDTWNGMQVRCEVTDRSGNCVASEAAAVTLNCLPAEE